MKFSGKGWKYLSLSLIALIGLSYVIPPANAAVRGTLDEAFTAIANLKSQVNDMNDFNQNQDIAISSLQSDVAELQQSSGDSAKIKYVHLEDGDCVTVSGVVTGWCPNGEVNNRQFRILDADLKPNSIVVGQSPQGEDTTNPCQVIDSYNGSLAGGTLEVFVFWCGANAPQDGDQMNYAIINPTTN